MGAPSSVDGLRLGLFVGFAASVVLFAVAWLGRYTEAIHSGKDIEAHTWGVAGAAYLQTAGLILAVAAVTGMAYAAFRPSGRRYTPLMLGGGTGRAGTGQPVAAAPVATDPQAAVTSSPVAGSPVTPSPATPGAAVSYCPHCGAPATDAEARFCGSCGGALPANT